jgi:peptidoglycan/LPS O-acetylase OafA/YrhL
MNRQYGALSGIAIIVIVLNHAITAGDTFSPVEGWVQNVLTILQALGTFAVPTFLFISGAFVAYAAKASKTLSLKFVWGSLERILWPYLVWSLIFYVVIIFSRQETYSVFGYIKNILVGFPFHFVPLLIFFYIVSPILVIFGKRFGWLLLLFIGLYQIFLIVMTDPAILGKQEVTGLLRIIVPPVLVGTMADWAIFFPMGLIFSMNNATIKPHLQKLKWLTAVVTVSIFIVGMLNAFGLLGAPWARYLAPVALMFLLPVIDRKSIPQVRRLEQVGKRSYGVYLSHFIVLDLTALLIRNVVPGLFNYAILVYPLFFVLALEVPLLLMDAMSKRPSTRKVYRYVFG